MGSGWSPAVLDDQTEVDFIRGAQRDFGDNTRSYFIAGSTNAEHNTEFGFDSGSYLPGNLGDYCA